MVFLNSISNLQVTQVFPRLVDLSPEKFQAALARILQVSLDQCFTEISVSYLLLLVLLLILVILAIAELSAPLECSKVRRVFQYFSEFVINHSLFISSLQPLVVTLVVKF